MNANNSLFLIYGLILSIVELESQLSGAEGTGIDVMESLVKASMIGQSSVDWSLARPQMAKSLSQHLCDGKQFLLVYYFSFILVPSSQFN